MCSRAGTLLLPLLVVAIVAVPSSAQARHPAPTAAAKPAQFHFIVAPTGNEARYRVREQLVGLDLPNDAVGVTKDITGTIVTQTIPTARRRASLCSAT